MKYLLFTSIVLAVTMCQKDIVSNDQLPLNTEVLIHNNTILSNQEEGIKLKMSEVVNDSRCPNPYDCVWEGDGAPTYEFHENNRTHIFNLHTTLTPKDTTLGPYNIRLISLLPYPNGTHVIPANQYKSIVIITKN